MTQKVAGSAAVEMTDVWVHGWLRLHNAPPSLNISVMLYMERRKATAPSVLLSLFSLNISNLTQIGFLSMKTLLGGSQVTGVWPQSCIWGPWHAPGRRVWSNKLFLCWSVGTHLLVLGRSSRRRQGAVSLSCTVDVRLTNVRMSFQAKWASRSTLPVTAALRPRRLSLCHGFAATTTTRWRYGDTRRSVCFCGDIVFYWCGSVSQCDL